MSEEAKDLIKQLLIRDPAQRLGVVNDGDDIKKHPFFKSVDWQEIEDRIKDGPYVEKDKSDKLIKEMVSVNFEDAVITETGGDA
jgi:protein-serine/threonine kinase